MVTKPASKTPTKSTGIKRFGQTSAATSIDPDRKAIEGGEMFILDDFEINTKNKRKAELALINGRSVTGEDETGNPIPGEPVKFYTFGEVLIEKMKMLKQNRELPCLVETVKIESDGNRFYYDFVNEEAGDE